jgi:hypothetical protein
LFVDAAGNVTVWSAGDVPTRSWTPPPPGTDPTDMSGWSFGGLARFDRDGMFTWANGPIRFGSNGTPVVVTARLAAGGDRLVMAGWAGGMFRLFTLDLPTGQWLAPLWQTANISGPRDTLVREWAGGVYALQASAGKAILAAYGPASTALWRSTLPLTGLVPGFPPALELDAAGNAFVAAVEPLAADPTRRDVAFLRFRPEGAGDPVWVTRYSQVTDLPWDLRDIARAELALEPDNGGGVLARLGLQTQSPAGTSYPVRELLRLSGVGRRLWRERSVSDWQEAPASDLSGNGQPACLSPDGSIAAAFWVGGGSEQAAVELVGQEPRSFSSPLASPRDVFFDDGQWISGSTWDYGLMANVPDPLHPGTTHREFQHSMWQDVVPLDPTATASALRQAGTPPRPWFLASRSLAGGAVNFEFPPGVHYVQSIDAGQVGLFGRGGDEAVIRAAVPPIAGIRVTGAFRFAAPAPSGSPTWPPQFQIRAGNQVVQDLPLRDWDPANPAMFAPNAPFDFALAADSGPLLDFAFRFAREPGAAAGFAGAGPVPVRSNVTFQAELWAPNQPPVVAIVAPRGGASVAPGTSPTVEADYTDPDSTPEAIEFFLDGRWVGTTTDRPFRLLLPPLAAGEHTVQARATDGDVSAWSMPLTLRAGPAPPAILVRSNDLQRLVFVTTATEALFRGETNRAGIVDSALISTIAAIRRQRPDLPVSFYEDLVDRVRAATGTAGPGTAVATLRPGVGLQGAPPDSDETLKYWLRVVPRIVKDVVAQTPIIGPPLVNSIENDLKEYARRCDQGGSVHQDDCDLVRFYGIKWKDVDDVVTEARDEILLAQRVLFKQFSGELWQHMDDQTGRIIGDSRAQFAGVNDQLGRVLGNIESFMDGLGNLRGDLDAFRAQVGSLFANVNEGIAAQLEIGQRTLELQHDTYRLLLDREEREQAAAAARAEREKSEVKIKGVESGLSLLTTFIGFSNPKLANQVTAIGENSLKIYAAIQAFNDSQGMDVSGFAAATLAGGYVGAGLAIAKAFSDSGGPSADEMILEQLGVIKQMIAALGEQMHERFDRVDKALNTIYTEFSRNFAAIDFRLGVIQGQLTQLQSALNEIDAKLDAIQRTQYLLAQDAALRDLDQAREEMSRFDPVTNPMGRETFTRLSAAFYNFEENVARSETFAPLRELGMDDTRIAGALATAGGVHGAVRYLAALAARQRWTAGRFAAADRNPVAWEAGVSPYLDLIESWPAFGRSIASVRTDLATMKAQGESLRTALADLTLVGVGGQLRANRPLWQALLDNYRAKAAAFADRLRTEEASSRRESLDPTGADPVKRAIADALDLWGPLDQPIPFTLPVPAGGIPQSSGVLNVGPLESPPGLATALAARSFGPLLLAEALGLTQTEVAYRDLDIGEVRPRNIFTYVYLMPPFLDCPGGWWDTNIWHVLESHLRVTLDFNTSIRTLGNVRARIGSSHYAHPTFHFHTGRYFHADCASGDSDCSAFAPTCPRVLREQPLPFFNPYIAASIVADGVYQGSITYYLWSSTTEQAQAIWKGTGEPRIQASPTDLPQRHPEWGRRPMEAARDKILTLAPVQSRIDTTTLQFPDGRTQSLRQVLEDLVEPHFRDWQRNFYAALPGKLDDIKRPLHDAGLALDGARAILESFLRLGLPDSFEKNDALRGFFLGNEPLPDAAEIARLAAKGVRLSRNSLDHRDRIRFDQIMNQRLDALSAAISNRLDAVERAGQPEVLPLLADTLDRVDQTIALLNQAPRPPLAPVLELIDTSANGTQVQIFGEPNVTYRLEVSPDLLTWTQVPTDLAHRQSLTIPKFPGSTWFFRARVLP